MSELTYIQKDINVKAIEFAKQVAEDTNIIETSRFGEWQTLYIKYIEKNFGNGNSTPEIIKSLSADTLKYLIENFDTVTKPQAKSFVENFLAEDEKNKRASFKVILEKLSKGKLDLADFSDDGDHNFLEFMLDELPGNEKLDDEHFGLLLNSIKEGSLSDTGLLNKIFELTGSKNDNVYKFNSDTVEKIFKIVAPDTIGSDCFEFNQTDGSKPVLVSIANIDVQNALSIRRENQNLSGLILSRLSPELDTFEHIEAILDFLNKDSSFLNGKTNCLYDIFKIVKSGSLTAENVKSILDKFPKAKYNETSDLAFNRVLSSLKEKEITFESISRLTEEIGFKIKDYNHNYSNVITTALNNLPNDKPKLNPEQSKIINDMLSCGNTIKSMSKEDIIKLNECTTIDDKNLNKILNEKRNTFKYSELESLINGRQLDKTMFSNALLSLDKNNLQNSDYANLRNLASNSGINLDNLRENKEISADKSTKQLVKTLSGVPRSCRKDNLKFAFCVISSIFIIPAIIFWKNGTFKNLLAKIVHKKEQNRIIDFLSSKENASDKTNSVSTTGKNDNRKSLKPGMKNAKETSLNLAGIVPAGNRTMDPNLK